MVESLIDWIWMLTGLKVFYRGGGGYGSVQYRWIESETGYLVVVSKRVVKLLPQILKLICIGMRTSDISEFFIRHLVTGITKVSILRRRRRPSALWPILPTWICSRIRTGWSPENYRVSDSGPSENRSAGTKVPPQSEADRSRP